MKLIFIFSLISAASFAGLEIKEEPNSVSAIMDGNTLWTYNHDPAEGKPYFHPLHSTDGTQFTGLRPEDHPWHRGVWFSWKFINGVNYWEESRETGKSDGETRIVSIDRKITDNKDVRLTMELEYSPSRTTGVVLKEHRVIAVSPLDENGIYRIDWIGTFTAQDKDVELNRTPLPGEKEGKPWGGYAGWSVRMNGEMTRGSYLNSEGLTDKQAHRQPARWISFNSPGNGSLLFMDNPANPNQPTKWYVAPGMAYFSPAVIHDAPYTITAGETIKLHYSLVVLPGKATQGTAEAEWQDWLK